MDKCINGLSSRLILLIAFHLVVININAQSNITLAYEQRAIASDAYNKIMSLSSEIILMKIQIQDLYDDIKRMQAELDALYDKRKRTMEDMKLGYYCDQCWKSKTELETSGEIFYSHLKRVGGQAVPAPPDKMLEKDKQFADQIADLKEEITRKTVKLNTTKPKLSVLYEQINPLPTIWQNAVTSEDKYRVLAWDKEIKDIDDRVSSLQSQINELDFKRMLESDSLKIIDLNYLVKVRTNDLDNLKFQKVDVELRQKIDKNNWIKQMVNENSSISKAMSNIGTFYNYVFGSLAGKTSFMTNYELNNFYDTPEMIRTPYVPASPSNNKNVRDYLENLGTPK